jgi:hypothetical protein
VTTPAPTDITTTNVLQGLADIFTGVFGAAEPANTAAVIDSTLWTFTGATDGGATLTLAQSYSNKMVDQVALPVGAELVTQEASVAVNLAEATLANLRRAMNAAASAGTSWELDSDVRNSDPNFCAVLLKGKAPGGAPRLVIVRRALSTANVGVPFKKDGLTVFPVTWSAYYVSTSIKAVKVDDTPGA